jgi:hypothetical protein
MPGELDARGAGCPGSWMPGKKEAERGRRNIIESRKISRKHGAYFKMRKTRVTRN